MNDLDHAIIAMGRSQAALPELLRRIGEGELWFLVPYHPEVEGEVMELKNGMPLPFVQLTDNQGPLVPLFSSFERTEEAMKVAGFPERTFLAASMPAKEALEILGKMELRAVLNKSCQTGQLIIPANLMRDVANGSALQPDTDAPPNVTESVKIIDPADYPTTIVQAAFDILRRHRNFRAAWVFERGENKAAPAGGRCFQFLVLMEPRDAAIFHEFNLVVCSARAPADMVDVGYLDEKDPAYIASLWRQAPAFYTAPDYDRPPGAI